MSIKNKLVLLLFSLYNKNDSINVQSVKTNIFKITISIIAAISVPVMYVTFSEKNKSTSGNSSKEDSSNNNEKEPQDIKDEEKQNIKDEKKKDIKDEEIEKPIKNQEISSTNGYTPSFTPRWSGGDSFRSYEEKTKNIQISFDNFKNIRVKILTIYEEISKINKEDILEKVFAKLKESEVILLTLIYNYYNKEFYENLDEINQLSILNKEEKEFLLKIKNTKNTNLFTYKELYELAINNMFYKDVNFLINKNTYNDNDEKINKFISINDFAIKINKETEVENNQYIYIKTYVPDFIYMENDKSLMNYIENHKNLIEYEINNMRNGNHNNNCYMYSLLDVIKTHIYKISQNPFENIGNKEAYISEILYEYELASNSMEEFLEKYNKNQQNKNQKAIRIDFQIMLNNFLNKDNFVDIKNSTKINILDNGDFDDDNLKIITNVLTKFFYYYLAFVRGPYYKDNRKLQNNDYIDNQDICIPFLADDAKKYFPILSNLFNTPTGIMISEDVYGERAHFKLKNKQTSKIFNSFFFEQFNFNNGHFICKFFMTNQQYDKYFKFLKQLQNNISNINIKQFEKIVPYNKDKDFLSILNDNIPKP